jgi:hypothetical protein
MSEKRRFADRSTVELLSYMIKLFQKRGEFFKLPAALRVVAADSPI